MKYPKVIALAVLFFSLTPGAYCQSDSTLQYLTQTKETRSKMSPQDALQMLKDGNKRFISGSKFQRDYSQQAVETAEGQYPFAIILGCIDSRSPSEIIFDQGIGDIFNARVAGNISNDDILGSMEFACKVNGSKLIVVIGHTSCGAIKGACDDVHLGNLTTLLAKIKPAVDAVSYTGERTSKNYDFVEKVAKENVLLTMENIKNNSSILKGLIDNGTVILIGAMYDIDTGIVTFYE
jgi:carbonic anhydrase